MGRANPAVLMRSEENKNKQLVVAMGGSHIDRELEVWLRSDKLSPVGLV